MLECTSLLESDNVGDVIRLLGPTEELVLRFQNAADFCNTANNIACRVRIHSKLPLSPDVLRQALTLIVRRHPLLHARIIPTEGNWLRRWLQGQYKFVAIEPESAFAIHVLKDKNWQDVMQGSFQQPWTQDGGPLLRVFLITSSIVGSPQDIVFWVSHAIGDGTSLFNVMGEVLSVAADLAEGKICEALPPSGLLRDVWAYAPKRRIRWIQLIAALSHYITTPFSPRVIRLPLDKTVTTTRYYNQTLSKKETAMIVTKSRALNTSVGGLVGAALMLGLPQTSSDKPMTTGLSSIVDLRRRTVPALPVDSLGHCASQVQTYYTLTAQTQLADLAQQVQEQVKNVLVSGLAWDVGRLIRIFVPMLMWLLRRGPIKFPYSVTFSNVGRVRMPTQLGPFALTRFHGVADYSFGKGSIFLAVATFNGQMTFDWTFSGVARKTVEDYAERVRTLLSETKESDDSDS
jgi:hypothetical protein